MAIGAVVAVFREVPRLLSPRACPPPSLAVLRPVQALAGRRARPEDHIAATADTYAWIGFAGAVGVALGHGALVA